MRKNWWKRGLQFAGVGLLVAAVATAPRAEAAEQFTDVAQTHYAYEAVNWAKAQGMISGYVDQNGQPTGKFGPSDTVTEGQFVKMLATYLQLEDKEGDLPKSGAAAWSDTYYDALAIYAVPVNGYFDQTLRNAEVKRGLVAQALGYTMGGEGKLAPAVQYLIDENISTGQNPQFEGKDTLRYFGTDNTLTRAQVVTFLHRLAQQNKETVSTEAKVKVSELETLVAKANVGVSQVDKTLKTGVMHSESKNPLVVMTMETGHAVVMELFPQTAPNTVNNFVSLIQSGYYNGLTFHRVIPEFMIQGGDPTGTGAGGPGYSIAGEFVANGYMNLLAHTRGVLSMARTNDPNSAGSQFFVMVADSPHLNGQYAAFGIVTDGMQTVDRIVAAERDASDKPLVKQTIEQMIVETFGVDYPEPIKQ